jgi:hypothetical protein
MTNDNFSHEEKLSDAFLFLGSQYYSLARYSAVNDYNPISATLFHHALEMFLKGFLIKKITLQELKNDSHALSRLWKKFIVFNPNLSSDFNLVIMNLDKIERIRYPEKIVDEKFRLNIMINTPFAMILPGQENYEDYRVEVTEIDAIIFEIFRSCNVSPSDYLNKSPIELRNTLPREFLSPNSN